MIENLKPSILAETTDTNKVRAREIASLYACIVLVSLAWFGIFRFFFNVRGVHLDRIAALFTNLCTSAILVLWTHRMKHLGMHDLGLRRGRWSVIRSASCGFIAGAVVFIVPLLYMGWADELVRGLPKNWLLLSLILPFSIAGMSQLVLGPINEEVLDRGLMYAYLKTKFSIPWSLVLQALIFSAMHPFHIARGANHFAIYFVGGLVLGLLFEKSRSLYPGIIAHSTLNYGNLLL